MKSIQTELAEGQTASSLQTFHEKETAAARRNAWRTQAKLACQKKAYLITKCVFTSFTRGIQQQRQQRRIFDFTPWLTRSLLFFIKSIWVLRFLHRDWSLSWRLPKAAAAVALALRAAPAEEENNDKKLHFSTVELMLLSSLSSYLIWRMKISRHDTYYSILCSFLV